MKSWQLAKLQLAIGNLKKNDYDTKNKQLAITFHSF